MFEKLKMFIWQYTDFSSTTKCPICKEELVPHGFEYHNRVYTCSKENCKFNEEVIK